MLSLNYIFSSGAVLPANKPLRIYGYGNGNITVTFNNHIKTTNSFNGEWVVEFDAMQYGGPYEITVSNGISTVTSTDIFIGEVYLISGQSNPELELHQTNVPVSDYANDDGIRMFLIDRLEEKFSYFKYADGWVKANVNSLKYWTAIGYLLAKRLRREKDVAIGLVCCFQGAATIETFLPPDICANENIVLPLEDRSYNPKHPCWKTYFWNDCSLLYEKMFSKVKPFAFNGVVWYQGEGNTGGKDSYNYDKLLTALINSWRHDLKDDDLEFFIVELHDYSLTANPENWQTVQRLQRKVCATLKNVNLITCKDLCEKDDIHPKTKNHIAERIADIILTK